MSLFLLLSLLGQVPGSFAVDPALRWYTLETEHFAVHFSSPERGRPDEESERLARRVARLCEAAHAALVPVAGWTPRGRTEVVIADFFDYSNGWAAPVPRNTITIIPTLPAGSRVGFDDWLAKLIIHEYAHIIQMDMVRGVPGFLRRVFGRAIVTNPLMPFWLLEGWAIKAETDLAGRGRAASTEYDMMLRAAADSNRLLPLDRAAHYSLERYPGGNAPYLYGGSFYRWVESIHGDTAWPAWHRRRSGGFPFFEEPHARRVFGRNFAALWRDWQEELRRHADSVGRRLEAEGLTPARPVTAEGFHTGSPAWSGSGRELYYLSRDGTEYPAIKAVDPATGARRVLHRGLVSGGLSLSPDGRRLAFAERRVWRNYYEYSDLWTLDLADRTLTRLTRGLRAADPDWSPDGRQLLFVINRTATTGLAVLDLETGEVRELTADEEPAGYSRPRYSPDGRYIAVSVNRPGGLCNIEIIDTRTGWVIPATEGRALNLAPEWSPTGKWLYYASDASGVFNIHAWSPDRDENWRCTNARWGLFEPAVSPDNLQLAVTRYAPDGNDIALIPLDPDQWQPAHYGPVTGEPGPPQPQNAGTDPDLRYPVYHYSPLPALEPALWLPVALPGQGGWTLGAMTFGWDALQLHRYTLVAGWQAGNAPGPRFSADYTWSGIRPALALQADLASDRQEFALIARLPFRRTRHHTLLQFGPRLTAATGNARALDHVEGEIGSQNSETGNQSFPCFPPSAFCPLPSLVTWSPPAALPPDTRTPGITRSSSSSPHLRWTTAYARSSARQYRFAAAPLEGGTINVAGALELRSALGARTRFSVFHDFRRWFRLPATASLRCRLAFGISRGDASADSAWQLHPGPAALGVRGFTESSGPGAGVMLAGLEYRVPLLRPERGIGTAPLFLSNLNAAAFADAGLIRPGRATGQPAIGRAGTGFELRADFILGHMLPTRLSTGAALGTETGTNLLSHQFYLGLESPLLAGLSHY